MKPPLELILPNNQNFDINRNGEKPNGDFPAIFTLKNCISSNFKKGKLIRNSYNDYHFYIENFELEIKEGLRIECEITIAGFFVIFLLEGNMGMQLNSNKSGIRLGKDNCFAGTSNKGHFRCHFSKGNIVSFILTHGGVG